MTNKDFVKLNSAKIGEDVLLNNGTVITVKSYTRGTLCQNCYFSGTKDCEKVRCNGKTYSLKFISSNDNTKVNHIDWEQRRFELVKTVMEGIFSSKEIINSIYDKEDKLERLQDFVCRCVNAIIDKLKENE